MEFLKELAISVGSSLLSALAMWLVSRYGPIREWINNHPIASSIIGMMIIYVAGFATLTYLLITVRTDNETQFAEFKTATEAKFRDLATYSAMSHSTQNGDMGCPPNMYVTSVSLPVINNAGFVGRGAVTCRPLNVSL